MRTATLTLCALAVVFAVGCKASQQHVKDISVTDAARAWKSNAVFVDANGDDFRKENGVVPGAILLDNYRTYDVARMLPADKDTPLIFYCSNKH